MDTKASKKSHKKRYVIGAVILILFIIGVASSAGKNNTAPTSTNIKSTSSQAKTTPIATAQPAPKVLLDQSGNGQAQTAAFTTGNTWTVTYTYDCSNFGSQGNFAFTVNNTDNSLNTDTGANDMGMNGGNTDHYYDSGKHYLSIDSECAWHIIVNG